MGCCVSMTRKHNPDPVKTREISGTSRRHSTVVPPPEEEETVVKEVLSETPTPKPPVSNPTRLTTGVLQEHKPYPVPNADVPEASDICSLTESVSTVPEKLPPDKFSGEVRQVVVGSPAKMRTRNLTGEGRESGAPARKPGPYLGRVGSRERNPPIAGRRDSGEISGRRSRSPAMRAAEVGGARSGPGRSPSTTKTGKSPGRVRSEIPTRRVEGGIAPPTAGDESLENPLVSLECFIFL